MPDTLVQDILDPEEIEKRAAWNKRLNLPILVSLDTSFKELKTPDTILSGEFVHKIDPESYRIKDETVTPAIIRCLGAVDITLPKVLEELKATGKTEALTRFCPEVCLLIDGTGHRNDLPETVLPNDQFVVNREKYSDNDTFVSTVKMLIGISLSNKGIGLRSKDQDFGFSKDHPFYIFVSAYDDAELRAYMQEAVKIADEFKDNLVRVVGFLAPKVG